MPAAGADLPRRRHDYRGGVTDTSRWDGFVPREDDVFICTPPKCGTTWMQAICAMLIVGKPELDFNPGDWAQWLDASFAPVDQVLAHFEAQTGRRVIKTHTPLDGIPFLASCTYLAVYRDPRDVCFSMLNHFDNMKLDVQPTIRAMPPEQAFLTWLQADFARDNADAFALARSVHHFTTFWPHRRSPNIHLFHYADLRRDLGAGIAEVARALDIEVSDERLAELVDAASFERMKERADRFVPQAKGDFWKDPSRFLNRGQNGQFRDVLSDASLAAYDARLRELLAQDQAAWLTHGSVATAE